MGDEAITVNNRLKNGPFYSSCGEKLPRWQQRAELFFFATRLKSSSRNAWLLQLGCTRHYRTVVNAVTIYASHVNANPRRRSSTRPNRIRHSDYRQEEAQNIIGTGSIALQDQRLGMGAKRGFCLLVVASAARECIPRFSLLADISKPSLCKFLGSLKL